MISDQRTIVFFPWHHCHIQHRYRKWAWSIACTCALRNKIPSSFNSRVSAPACIHTRRHPSVGGGSGAEEAHAPPSPGRPSPFLSTCICCYKHWHTRSTHGVCKRVPHASSVHTHWSSAKGIGMACSVLQLLRLNIHRAMDSIPQIKFYAPPSFSLVPSLSAGSVPRQMLFGSHSSLSIAHHHLGQPLAVHGIYMQTVSIELITQAFCLMITLCVLIDWIAIASRSVKGSTTSLQLQSRHRSIYKVAHYVLRLSATCICGQKPICTCECIPA